MPSRPAFTPALKLAVAAGLTASLLGLSACGSSGSSSAKSSSPSPSATSAAPSASSSPSPSATASVKPADNLDAITVTGGYGKKPTIKIAKTPWAIDQTRTKVLSPGKGDTVTGDMSVEINYEGVDGRTGKKFDSSFDRGQTATFPLQGVIPGFKKGLEGQKQGSRVLIAMPGKDAYDSSGGQPTAGIELGDTLVFVVDIVAIPLAHPEGDKVSPKAGLPTVSDSLTDPQISVPKANPPAQTQVQLLIKGTGKKVTSGDVVTSHYKMVDYATGKVLGSDYGKPASQNPVASLPTGFQKGIVGQPVGSRVLLVIPPKDAFPNGSDNPKVEPGTTVVVVVDLLFASAANPGG